MPASALELLACARRAKHSVEIQFPNLRAAYRKAEFLSVAVVKSKCAVKTFSTLFRRHKDRFVQETLYNVLYIFRIYYLR